MGLGPVLYQGLVTPEQSVGSKQDVILLNFPKGKETLHPTVCCGNNRVKGSCGNNRSIISVKGGGRNAKNIYRSVLVVPQTMVVIWK